MGVAKDKFLEEFFNQAGQEKESPAAGGKDAFLEDFFATAEGAPEPPMPQDESAMDVIKGILSLNRLSEEEPSAVAPPVDEVALQSLTQEGYVRENEEPYPSPWESVASGIDAATEVLTPDSITTPKVLSSFRGAKAGGRFPSAAEPGFRPGQVTPAPTLGEPDDFGTAVQPPIVTSPDKGFLATLLGDESTRAPKEERTPNVNFPALRDDGTAISSQRRTRPEPRQAGRDYQDPAALEGEIKGRSTGETLRAIKEEVSEKAEGLVNPDASGVLAPEERGLRSAEQPYGSRGALREAPVVSELPEELTTTAAPGPSLLQAIKDGATSDAMLSALKSAADVTVYDLPRLVREYLPSLKPLEIVAEGAASRADYYRRGMLLEKRGRGEELTPEEQQELDDFMGTGTSVDAEMQKLFPRQGKLGDGDLSLPAPGLMAKEQFVPKGFMEKAFHGFGSHGYGLVAGESDSMKIRIPLLLATAGALAVKDKMPGGTLIGAAAPGVGGAVLKALTNAADPKGNIITDTVTSGVAKEVLPHVVRDASHAARMLAGLRLYAGGSRAEMLRTLSNMDAVDGLKYKDILSYEELDNLSAAFAILGTAAEFFGLETFYKLFPGSKSVVEKAGMIDFKDPRILKAVMAGLTETAKTYFTEVGTEVMEEFVYISAEEYTAQRAKKKFLESLPSEQATARGREFIQGPTMNEALTRLASEAYGAAASFFLSTLLLPGMSNMVSRAEQTSAAKGNIQQAARAQISHTNEVSLLYTGLDLQENVALLEEMGKRGDNLLSGVPVIDLLRENVGLAKALGDSLRKGDRAETARLLALTKEVNNANTYRGALLEQALKQEDPTIGTSYEADITLFSEAAEARLADAVKDGRIDKADVEGRRLAPEDSIATRKNPWDMSSEEREASLRQFEEEAKVLASNRKGGGPAPFGSAEGLITDLLSPHKLDVANTARYVRVALDRNRPDIAKFFVDRFRLEAERQQATWDFVDQLGGKDEVEAAVGRGKEIEREKALVAKQASWLGRFYEKASGEKIGPLPAVKVRRELTETALALVDESKAQTVEVPTTYYVETGEGEQAKAQVERNSNGAANVLDTSGALIRSYSPRFARDKTDTDLVRMAYDATKVAIETQAQKKQRAAAAAPPKQTEKVDIAAPQTEGPKGNFTLGTRSQGDVDVVLTRNEDGSVHIEDLTFGQTEVVEADSAKSRTDEDLLRLVYGEQDVQSVIKNEATDKGTEAGVDSTPPAVATDEDTTAVEAPGADIEQVAPTAEPLEAGRARAEEEVGVAETKETPAPDATVEAPVVVPEDIATEEVAPESAAPGLYVRAGSISGRVVEVLPDGRYRLENRVVVTPNAAQNWAEQSEPFVAVKEELVVAPMPEESVKPAEEGLDEAVVGTEGPMAKEEEEVSPGTSRVKTDAGMEVDTKFAFVEAPSLIVSNKLSGAVNPDYPAELQPRQRDREASRSQVEGIISRLDPERLGDSVLASDGAPIVAPDGVVESGNGRVLALLESYRRQTDGAKRYRQWLRSNASVFGLDASTLESMKFPILVRERTSDVDRVRFTQEANQANTLRMSAAEQAKADAGKLSPDILALLVPSESGDLLAGNSAFVRAFRDAVVTSTELASFLDSDGRLSQEGVARVRNAIFAAAYGDSSAIARMSESTDDNIKNIVNGLVMAAPQMAMIQSEIANGTVFDLGIAADIVSAMRTLSDIRTSGRTVEQFVAQIPLFGDSDLSPFARTLLLFFDEQKRSYRKIGDVMSAYPRALRAKGDPRVKGLLEEIKAPTKNDVFESARKLAGVLPVEPGVDVQGELGLARAGKTDESEARLESPALEAEVETKTEAEVPVEAPAEKEDIVAVEPELRQEPERQEDATAEKPAIIEEDMQVEVEPKEPAQEPVSSVSLEFGSYNQKRYGTPWGAQITFGPDNKPKYNFSSGSYLGNDDGGEVVVRAIPGDVVAFGQKDYRGRGGMNTWHVVQEDGSLQEISRPDARRHLLARDKAKEAEPEAVAKETPRKLAPEAPVEKEVQAELPSVDEEGLAVDLSNWETKSPSEIESARDGLKKELAKKTKGALKSEFPNAKTKPGQTQLDAIVDEMTSQREEATLEAKKDQDLPGEAERPTLQVTRDLLGSVEKEAEDEKSLTPKELELLRQRIKDTLAPVEDKTETKTEAKEEERVDERRDDTDDAKSLEDELPEGVQEPRAGRGTETGDSLREADSDGDGRAEVDRAEQDGRRGVDRSEAPVLHDPTADVGSRESGDGSALLDTPDTPDTSAQPDSKPQSLREGGKPSALSGKNPGNFVIDADFPLGQGTDGEKIAANLDAIRLLKKITAEGRFATKDEQAILARYVGWGGLKSVFDVLKKDSNDMFGRAQRELKELLSQEEYDAAFGSISNAHYTSRETVNAMWQVMRHLGFRGGKALEPTVGVGNFLGLTPRDFASSTEWHAAELDSVSGEIASLLYPDAEIMGNTGFQRAPFADGAFDIAIGNPPFGSETITDKTKRRSHLSGMKIHNYIIAKTAMHLRPGGAMAMVVTHRFLDTANPEARSVLAKDFRFLGSFRLANDAFKANAGTNVVTDVIFLQKLRAGEKPDLKAAWLDTNGRITVDGQTMRVNRYYQENPENILGRSAMDGKMTRREGEEYTVHSDGRDVNESINALLSGAWADLANVIDQTETERNDVAAVLEESQMGIGALTLDEDGNVYYRDYDDNAGNAVVTRITEETLWKDQAKEWKAVLEAAQELKSATQDGTKVVQAMRDFLEASEFAYSGDWEKRQQKRGSSATKAHQAIYTIVDAVTKKGGDFAWAFDASLEDIRASYNRKQLGAPGLARIKGILALRKKLAALGHAERSDAANIEALRRDLNSTYERFVKDFGLLSESKNMNVMNGDIRAEFGLEIGFEPKVTPAQSKRTGVPVRDASATKADILSRRVFFPTKEITHADTPTDALKISLSERGRPDIGYMAKLTGMPESQLISDLSSGANPQIFLNPDTKTYEHADEYLSGNVKAKMERAISMGLKEHAAALSRVQPAPKTKEQVTPSIRSPWIPASVFVDFLRALGAKSPRVAVNEITGHIGAEAFGEELSPLGVGFTNAYQQAGLVSLFNAAASGKTIRVTEKDDNDRTVVDPEGTRIVGGLVEKMDRVFQTWAFSDGERTQQVLDAYNQKMNTHVDRAFDGVNNLRLVGASPSITLRRSQSNAAWRMIQAKNVLLDHVVGAGKTFTMIAGVMERRRLGLSKKALVVVPNHLISQWATDFYRLYPGARILAASPADFQRKNRRRLFARMATGDFDAIIIGHSSFGYLPAAKADQETIIKQQIDALEEALSLEREGGTSKRTMGQIANRLTKYKDKLLELQARQTDDVGFDFTTMGFDSLLVDEAHEYKNLEYLSTGERLVQMNDPKGVSKAFDLYTKVRGLQERGGTVTFATGTPISNSLVEAYTFMKYLAHDELVSRNQLLFDAWAGAYTEAETRAEFTPTQRLKLRRVLSGVINLDALYQIYSQFADTITNADLKRDYKEDMEARNKATGRNDPTDFPIPNVLGGTRQFDLAPATQAQIEFIDYLVARTEAVERNKGNAEYGRVDNMLWIMSDAKKASLDMRTIDPNLAREGNSKVSRASEKIKAIYDKWDDQRGAQLVFCDSSVPGKTATIKARKSLREAATLLFGSQAKANALLKEKAEESLSDTWLDLYRQLEDLAESSAPNAQEAGIFLEDKASDITTETMVADAGFSVYEDLKELLMGKGIPEREIAFIHDYDTPAAKSALFDRVNSGYVRVLIGSSAKMGAGMNAQERLVALHHLDAPWRPSDMEQREGRIIRQGNKLYLLDPEGFAVELIAYSAAGTADTVSWQILERKAAAIEAFRKGAKISKIEESSSDADQYADFMTSSTGNPVFKLKLVAERAFNDKEAETGGILVAQQNATDFLSEFLDRKKKIETTIKAFSEGKADVAAAEAFTEALLKAEEDFGFATRAYSQEREITEAAVAAWEAKPEGTRGVKPKMPVEPQEPRPFSPETTATSAYMEALRKGLTRIDEEETTEKRQLLVPFGDFTVKIVKSEATSSGKPFWDALVYRTGEESSGQFSLVHEYIQAKFAMRSNNLLEAITPVQVNSLIKDIVVGQKKQLDALIAKKKYYESNQGLSDVQAARQELDEARATQEWFKAQVSFAEVVSDVARQGKPNQFIAQDTKRPLDVADEKRGEVAPVVFSDVEGKGDFKTSGIFYVFSIPNTTLEVTYHQARSLETGKQVILVEDNNNKTDGRPRISVIEQPETARRMEETYLAQMRRDSATLPSTQEVEKQLSSQPDNRVDLDAKIAGALNEGKEDFDPRLGMTIKDISKEKPSKGQAGKASTARAGSSFEFNSEEVATALDNENLKGIPKESLANKLRKSLAESKAKITRTFEFLPHTKKLAEAIETFRRWEMLSGTAQADTLKYLKYITSDLDQETMGLFNQVVALADFAQDAKEGMEIPFGLDPTEVGEELARLSAYINEHAPVVNGAIAKRNEVWRVLKNEYVESGKSVRVFGTDRSVDEVFTRGDSYFRHQVLKYARDNLGSGSGSGGIHARANRGWHKAREGTTEAINVNYLQAEYEVMSQLLTDKATFDALARLTERYDITPSLKKKAQQENLDNYYRAKRAEFRRAGKTLAEEKALARKALDALVGMERSRDRHEEMAIVLAQEKLPYYRQNSNDWMRLIPETHTAYQATDGQVFYKAWSIPEKMAKDLLEGIYTEVGLSADKLNAVLAKGRGKDPIVVPVELAEQLNSMKKKEPPRGLSKWNRAFLSQWKRFVLFAPQRIAKYEFRNLTGDLEGPLMGNVGAFQFVGQSIKELGSVIFKDQTPTGELAEWMGRGGLESTQSIKEAGDLLRAKDFEKLYKGKESWEEAIKSGRPLTNVWDGYWEGVGKYASMQESVLRYAAYRSYLKQMQANKQGRPDNFGASNREFIMGLSDIRDRAYHLSNDLLVAYDMTSVTGKKLSAATYPFWRFQEGNFRRYLGLTRNAWLDAKEAAELGEAVNSKFKLGAKLTGYSAVYLGRLMFRMFALTAAASAWNLLRFPDEEGDLPKEEQDIAHIIFGSDSYGRTIYFRNIGTLSDFSSWFGFDAAPGHVYNLMSGREGWGDIALDVLKAPAQKVMGGLNPGLNLATELLLGLKLYPDPFQPRAIRDKWQHLADFFLVGTGYRLATGRPLPGGKAISPEALVRSVAYLSDPGESAYWEAINLKNSYLERQGKVHSTGARISPRSRALWRFKTAVRMEDVDAADRYLNEYFDYVALEWQRAGKNFTNADARKAFDRAIASMNPLAGLNKREKGFFLQELTEREFRQVERAVQYYEADLLSLGSPPSKQSASE